jgi:hypothetical protein
MIIWANIRSKTLSRIDLENNRMNRKLTKTSESVLDYFYTLVIEASFVAIERTIEFRLLEQGRMNPEKLPGSHPGVYREAAEAGIFTESTADDIADLWRDHRAKTYYQDGLAAAERAEKMQALATEIHAFIIGRSAQGHEYLCNARR